MGLIERVSARLDELQHTAPSMVWLGKGYALGVWLPSLRRRAERHAPGQPQVEHRCRTTERRDDKRRGVVYYDEVPCQDFLDLCAEIGVEP